MMVADESPQGGSSSTLARRHCHDTRKGAAGKQVKVRVSCRESMLERVDDKFLHILPGLALSMYQSFSMRLAGVFGGVENRSDS
ncbi:hypothetical protein EUTSA_v10019389mg [Eutrema salsugineum]|uniref:Uncharacterized protein n=1 Tax=Eutrema salsugineum TaxID=72664 RepID=V4MBI5_EUTSA|nr:hypothetical protein EUTSA_v10019389mg [Eutrema salsugineum]